MGGVASSSLGVLDHSLSPSSGIEGSVPVVHQGGQEECRLQIESRQLLRCFLVGSDDRLKLLWNTKPGYL